MPAEKSASQWYFPEVYLPTVFDNLVSSVQVNGKTVEKTLWDARGEEEQDNLRPSQFPETDVTLTCFLIVPTIGNCK